MEIKNIPQILRSYLQNTLRSIFCIMRFFFSKVCVFDIFQQFLDAFQLHFFLTEYIPSLFYLQKMWKMNVIDELGIYIKVLRT